MEINDKVIVLILNYNSADLTMKHTDRMIKSGVSCRFVITDNHSSGRDYERLLMHYGTSEQVDVIRTDSNTGYASGNNFGIEYIVRSYPSAGYVAVMNPDFYIDKPETLDFLASYLSGHQDIAAVSCRILKNGKESATTWRFPDFRHLVFGNSMAGNLLGIASNDFYSEQRYDDEGWAAADVLSGCFFMMDVKKAARAGFFDPDTFLYYEETILAKRLKKKGYTCAVTDRYTGYHNHQEKDKSLENPSYKKRDLKWAADSKIIYLKKYSGWSMPVRLSGIFIIRLDRFIRNIRYDLIKVVDSYADRENKKT